MNGLWIRNQYGDHLMLAQEFEIEVSDPGHVYIYANCRAVAVYKSMERALEVMNDIEAQLIKGSSFDDMYKKRRVSKCNVFHFPKE